MKNLIAVFVLIAYPAFCFAQKFTLAHTMEIPEERIVFAPKNDDVVKANDVYKLNLAADIPITAAGIAWCSYAFSKIYSKDTIPYETVKRLNKDDLNSFDRWAAGKTNQKLSDGSDFLFYGSIPLPAFLFIDRRIRKDALKISALYLEAFSITGLLYTGSAYFIDRYRPETYNTSLPIDDRANGNNKNSFFAGHVAVVATATFFMAKVYSDYHPESKWKWAFWGGAAAATGTMVYFRHAAGKHFPSDLVVGTAIGVLSGVLVPHFHKYKDPDKRTWGLGPSVNPDGDGVGLRFTYRFK